MSLQPEIAQGIAGFQTQKATTHDDPLSRHRGAVTSHGSSPDPRRAIHEAAWLVPAGDGCNER